MPSPATPWRPSSTTTTSTAPAAGSCARSARRGCCATPSPRRTAGAPSAWMCGRSASFAKHWLACRTRGFRLRHAGARHRAGHPVRHHGAARALAAARRRRNRHRRLCPVGAGGGVRCRGARLLGQPRRQRPCPSRRREDLDLEWRHRGPLRRLRAHRRGTRRQGAVGFRCRSGYTGARGRRTPRHHRAASSGPPALRSVPRAGLRADRGPGRRLPDRHGDARRVPLDRGRGSARLRASRARRDAGTGHAAPPVRRPHGGHADRAGSSGRHGRRCRCRRPHGLPRGLDQGRRRAAHQPRRRRWPSWSGRRLRAA